MFTVYYFYLDKVVKVLDLFPKYYIPQPLWPQFISANINRVIGYLEISGGENKRALALTLRK